jgi:sterol desaturase/sphingolipid hydroxylase (fatty acid hydroxylase superfamily)
MSKNEQRDLFLVLTVVGLFASFVIIVGSTVLVIGIGKAVLGEIKAWNTPALFERLRVSWPASVIASLVLLGTFFSYRCYHRLTFNSE